MTGLIVQAGARDWRLFLGAPPIEAARFQAIIVGQVLDELTGVPPLAPLEVSTRSRGIAARASTAGRIGLAGRPAALFPHPWPAPAPTVHIRVTSRDHLPVERSTKLDPQPNMPGRYTPADFGAIDLHRRPTSFSGRLVSRSTGPAAPGIAVVVTTYWETFADMAGPGLAANALCLWSGLYADRPLGTTARRVTLNLLDPKRLDRDAPAGATQLLLSNRQGLLVTRPIAIEPGDPEREEYIGVAAIDTSLSPDQPALVTLKYPLKHPHRTGTIVQRTTVGPAGALHSLDRPAQSGDVSLYLDSLGGILPTHRTIEIATPAIPALANEYHSIALWQTLTVPGGAFRLPPIHRAAHLRIEVVGPPVVKPIRVTLNAPGDALADLVFD